MNNRKYEPLTLDDLIARGKAFRDTSMRRRDQSSADFRAGPAPESESETGHADGP